MRLKIFYGWWIVLASYFIGLFVAGTVFYGFTAFMEPLVAEFGWSYAQVSLATSLRGLEMGLFAPIVGILVDRFGTKMVTLLGIIIVGLGMIILSQTNSLPTFYAAFLLLGFGAGGCTSVVIMTAVANWFNKKVSLALGLAAAGFGSGGLLVPLIVWMIDHLQWRSTYLILGLCAWAIGIPISFIFRSRPEKYGYLPDGEKAETPPAAESEDRPRNESANKTDDITFRKAAANPSFWYLNLSEAIRMLIVVSIITHVMPYLESLGIPRSMAGLVAGGLAVFSVIGRIGFGYLGDLYDKRYVMAASYALMTVGLVVFAGFIRGPISLFIFLILFAPGFGGGMIMRGSLLREYFGTFSYGKILGVTMGIGSVAAIIGPTLAGWIYDTVGSYQSLWLAYIFLILAAIVLVSRIKPLTS